MVYKLSHAIAIFAVSFSIGSAFAGECSSEVVKNTNGAYTGCQVKSSGKEYLIGTESSSESGCKFVCTILGEVNESRGKVKKTQHLTASAL